MALLDRELLGTRGVVESVGRHWVVVCVVGSSHIEEHAVGLSISETLALCIGLAGGAARGPRVLGARRVEVVCSNGLRVSDDSASRGCWGRGG